MTNSVLVFSPGRDPVDGGAGIVALAPGSALAFLENMIAKEEREEDGALAVHLNPDFCAMERKEDYALYACSGDFHVSEPLLVFPKGSIRCARGDHEFECHHNSLPIM